MRELFADFPHQGDFLACLGHNVMHTRFPYTLIKAIKCSHQRMDIRFVQTVGIPMGTMVLPETEHRTNPTRDPKGPEHPDPKT